MAMVKNLHNTGSHSKPAGYDSWIDFWEQHTYRKANLCSCIRCTNKATLGGHVKKIGPSMEWYITPICDSCNHNEDAYYVADYDLVPVSS